MLGKLSNEQIDSLLRTEVIGRIGCHADNKTYIVPITYVFDGDSIIGHTSEGLKIEILRKNPMVCFQVDKIDNMMSWQSAIVWGIFEELEGYDARFAMQKLITRMLPLTTDDVHEQMHGIEKHQLESGGTKTIIYRINIFEKTGRFKEMDNG
jgi:uncharacterized protein